jgi:hypothetical protein
MGACRLIVGRHFLLLSHWFPCILGTSRFEYCGGMDWVQDMTSRWMRIMSAADGGGTPLDEAVRQISAIGDAPAKKGGPGWLRRKGAAAGAAVEEASAVTVLCRQLIAGVLVSDLAIARLCTLENRSREQVVAELADDVPGQLRDEQLRALQAELSGGCSLLKDPERASYAGLGTRIEQLLRLAEQQASELIEAARAEAAGITASAHAGSAAPSGSGSGSGSGHDEGTEGRLGA